MKNTAMNAFAKIISLCALVTMTGLVTTLGASPQTDPFQPLREDARMREGLTVIAVGRQVHEQCPTIRARLMRALIFAESLSEHAMTLGFRRSEVMDYIDDRAEQDRYTEVAQAYFAERGYDWEDSDSVCALGRAEIAAGSPIGRLLRE